MLIKVTLHWEDKLNLHTFTLPYNANIHYIIVAHVVHILHTFFNTSSFSAVYIVQQVVFNNNPSKYDRLPT